MTRRLFPFLFLGGQVLAGCLPVSGDRILGRDLAKADPSFRALPATLIVGYAPAPGTKRVIAAAELLRIARANNIPVSDPVGVCFEVPTRRLTAEDVTAAMLRVLPRDSELTIVEFPTTDVPVGGLDFPLASLEPASPLDGATRVWRGSVRYSNDRGMPVWARVTVSRRTTAVIAARDLTPNLPIEGADLIIENRSGPLSRELFAVGLEEVLGRVPRRTVKAGETIPLRLLDEAPAVRRGDAVSVEVVCGPAVLKLDAVVERDARKGELVELRNPSTGKTFRARLEGGKAVVVVGAGQSL